MIGVGCLIHGRHPAPVPIEAHRIRPPCRGGDLMAAAIPLCANAHGLVHALIDEIETVAVSAPHATMHQAVRMLDNRTWASYPGRVRLVAYRSWQSYGAAFVRRRYRRQFELWDSAGRARAVAVPAYGQLARLRDAPWRLRWEISRM